MKVLLIARDGFVTTKRIPGSLFGLVLERLAQKWPFATKRYDLIGLSKRPKFVIYKEQR